MATTDDQLRSTLAAVAPGTGLRDGLERILRGNTGALIVLGYDRAVESLCTGGFPLDVEFSSTRLRELAKMDGAIVLDNDGTRIVRAAVHLVPDPTIPTEESGTRHRTAERVAKQTGYPGHLGQPVDADHRALRRRPALRRSTTRRRSCPGPTRRSPRSSATSCASTRWPARCPRWRSRTWSPCATRWR